MSTTHEPHPTDRSGTASAHSLPDPDFVHPELVRPETRAQRTLRYVGAVIRLSLGWVFLWAFLDKTFGLGYATPAEGAWINGGHPTSGFLEGATTGPFADFYQGLAGQAWVDWVFMIGLLGVGLALILGIGMRVAAVAGALMLVLMWTAVLPPANNPFMDDHLVYALVLVALALGNTGTTLGLGTWWQQTRLVRRWPWLT
ncbi:DoxX family protein [Oerskovia turbata]|uniref:DoxX family protein n=1 Tax=Oerskovia turbata TaxID=1713 RepID=A0A4Q1KYT5_9CELL|nr:DoxX family protein [Oerskovia turbata]RXR24751.1 DoxX family protein [Oerskovia turbata]RXR35045.1 DoxX family protein [Oerskovia turbata]TGJ97111.1 DoxX family protein [Actinotalea fermentans ATCC 43279 = JCM 9966 = DSM 3133]